MHWFRAAERYNYGWDNVSSRKHLFVKNPPNWALTRKRRREDQALNAKALSELPFSRVPVRLGGPSRRVGCDDRSRHGLRANPSIFKGLKVTSSSKLAPSWYARLRKEWFTLPTHPFKSATFDYLLKRDRMCKASKAPQWAKDEVFSGFRAWEVAVREKYPGAEWELGWSVSKPSANSVRSLKRRWFFLTNVVKKLPSSVRVDLVKLDVRAFYALKRKLTKRGAKHVSLGKFWSAIRSNSIKEKRWTRKRRRKR
jgi:hypothetical protein